MDTFIQHNVCLYDDARAIMGENFFGIEEARKYLGATVSDREKEIFSTAPWNAEELNMYSDSCILASIFPISILEMREKLQQSQVLKPVFDELSWYDDQEFFVEKKVPHWLLMKKVPKMIGTISSTKSLADLEDPTNYPSVTDLVYIKICYAIATGDYLFTNMLVVTSSRCRNNSVVTVSCSTRKGIALSCCGSYSVSSFSGCSVVRPLVYV